MLVYIYSSCPITAIGLEHTLFNIIPKVEIVLFDTLPTSKALIGTKPDFVFIKTTGFDAKSWQGVSLNQMFSASCIIWIKTPLDSDKPLHFEPHATLELEANLEKVQQVLSNAGVALKAQTELPEPVHQAYELLQKHGKLNKRLAEVFHHLTTGKSYKEIASIMGKSHRTIEKDGIYLKKLFGVESKTAFAQLLDNFNTSKK